MFSFLFLCFGGNNSLFPLLFMCHCIIFSIQKQKGKNGEWECSFLCRMLVCMYGLSFFITHKCLFSSFFLFVFMWIHVWTRGGQKLMKKILVFPRKLKKSERERRDLSKFTFIWMIHSMASLEILLWVVVSLVEMYEVRVSILKIEVKVIILWGKKKLKKYFYRFGNAKKLFYERARKSRSYEALLKCFPGN